SLKNCILCLLFTLRLLFFIGVQSDIVLSQKSSEVKKPGESLCMTCQVSGFSLSSYSAHWIRQPPGKGLQWVGYYSKSIDSRFKVTEDSSNNLAHLDISNVLTEDMGVYYCARRHS
uniref:Immunoglobulin heavy variable 1-1 n=1 Tax=Erpetoichthys calabaricus TaxID=27687 RepID=A0A8C4SZ06_ERPCA